MKHVTVKLTFRQAMMLEALMDNLDSITTDQTVRRDARNILNKLIEVRISAELERSQQK